MDPPPAMATAASSGGDEVLEGVRELLRAQRRLERLVAGLAGASGAQVDVEGSRAAALVGGGGGGGGGPSASGEGPEARAAEGSQATGESRIPLVPDVTATAAESQAWLERAEVRDELASCGSSGQLSKECEAAVRSSTSGGGGFQEHQSSPSPEEPKEKSPVLRASHSFKRSKGKSRLQLRPFSFDNAPGSAWLTTISHSYVLSPMSNAKAWIDTVMFCVLTWNLSALPYALAFDLSQGETHWTSYLSTCFWSIDMILCFRTGYYHNGRLQMDPRHIALHYLKTNFVVDLLLLTIDYVTFMMHALNMDSSDDFKSASLLRVLKVARVMRLLRAMKMRHAAGVLETLGARAFSAKALVGSIIQVCNFMLILIWINHVIACCWCYLGRGTGTQYDTGYTWMDLSSGGLAGSYSDYEQGYQYATALHWAITQMTPGSMQVFPVNSTERAFNIVVLICGLLMFSVLVSAISATAVKLRIDVHAHSEKMHDLTMLLRRSRVHPEIRMHVCTQVKAKLLQGTVRPQALTDLAEIELLSLSLRHALQLALCCPHFLEHPLLDFFSDADRAMWEETCMTCAHFSVLRPGDQLFVFGVRAEGMYFVARGALSYELDCCFAEQLPIEAKPGAWISEAALWCHWRHMGCAEALGDASCEVLLLRAAALMPILTRKGLTGQLAWAYARSFYRFLQNAKPPLSDWPNDLVLPFGADEVIAAMPKDATVVMGQGAIRVLMGHPGKLGSWRGTVSEDNIDKLTSEVMDGGSTLLSTGSQGVVRCVPMVVLQLRHPDGRVFVRMRFGSRADGSQEAICDMPGSKQRVGEHQECCLQRLLEELTPVADSITMVGVEIKRQRENSKQFGVPTRYVRTVVSAELRQPASEDIKQFLVLGVPCSRQSGILAEGGHRPSGPAPEVFMFPGHRDFYAWLTDGQLSFFTGSQGQQSLSLWLSELHREVEGKLPVPPGDEAGGQGSQEEPAPEAV